MKKVSIITSIIACTLMCCLLWSGQTKAAGETGTTTASSLNVRTSAVVNGDTNRLKYNGAYVTLPKGTTVTVLETVTGWYRVSFPYSNTTLEGFVSSTYVTLNTVATPTPTSTDTSATSAPVATSVPITVYKSTTYYKPINVPAKVKAKVLVRKTAGGKYLKVGKTKVSLKKNQSVRVLGHRQNGKVRWYKVSFYFKKKKKTAYVHSDYIKLTTASKIPAKVSGIKKLKMKKAANGKKYYKVSGKTVTCKSGTAVYIRKEVTKAGKKWFQISFTYKKKTRKAYTLAKYIALTKKKVTAKVAATQILSTADFEAYLTAQGFPESYKPELRKLHAKYPYWQFNAFHTSMTWADAIKNETKVGLNLIPNSKSAAWKSKASGAYDSSTGKYIVFDGSTWVTASELAVKYYMDPRNFLTDNMIFQFEVLDYQPTYQIQTGIENILNNTPFHQTSFTYTENGTNKSMTYSAAFIAAAAKSGVSPYHLAARVRQEVVTGTNTTTKAVTGTNSTYPSIYNFYNIGAFHGTDPALNGLLWASGGTSKATTYMRPWNNRYKAIVGGATYLGENYINQGQNTNYLQKFNVTEKKTYWHQFMANVQAAASESYNTKKAYGTSMDGMPILFSIPVYSGMPDSACAIPGA